MMRDSEGFEVLVCSHCQRREMAAAWGRYGLLCDDCRADFAWEDEQDARFYDNDMAPLEDNHEDFAA